MARRCRICDKAEKPGQPTAMQDIHGTLYTVHAACKDIYTKGKSEAEKKWNFRTMKQK